MPRHSPILGVSVRHVLLRMLILQELKQFQQLQGGSWRVIAYASRNLTNVERRYSQTEKKGLALACEEFKLYVYGRKLTN